MQLEVEYDQLKHQLSPRHKQNSVSPGMNKQRKNIKSILLFLI